MKTLLQRTKGETRRGMGLVNINSFKKLKRNVTTNALIIKRYRVEGRLIVFVFNEKKELKMLTDNNKLSNR